MNTSTRTDSATVRTSTLDRPTLMALAGTEYERFWELLDALEPDDWQAPTSCPGWDVRAMASHVLGMAEMVASITEGIRQQRKAARSGGVFIDALTALQVDERRSMSPVEITTRLKRTGLRAARARRRTPGLVRRRKMPVPQPVGDALEDWSLGYLLDTVLTRDPWMHRSDIAQATGKPLRLTADHDGVLVADVVEEWRQRHGRSFDLTLTGPAGGHWTRGTDGEQITLDAVEFCRALCGRARSPQGLLAVQVPF